MMSLTFRRRTLAAVAAVLATAALPSAAHAATPTEISTSVARGIGYLGTIQQNDGRFATSATSPELDWALGALAAAGKAPADMKTAGGTANAREYYQALIAPSTWPSASPPVTDLERAALNAYGAGIDPARASVGQNLIARIYGNWQPSTAGYWGTPSLFNGTVFGLLALAGSKTTGGVQRVPQAILDKSIARVRANQHTDGGWSYQKVEGNHSGLTSAGDVDMTGAAIASLCAAGVSTGDSAVVAGKNFLKGKLITATGAFTAMSGPNTDSNAWAVQGLKACQIDTQGADFTTPSPNFKTPIDFLVTQQFAVANGGWKWLPTDSTANAYTSTDALRAMGTGGFTATPPVPATTGQAQWVAESNFSTTGTASKLGVSVDDSSGTLKVCSLSVSPSATTTTLGAAIDAGIGTSTPAGCLTAVTPTTSTGTITSLNGTANSGGSSWKVSIDGAGAATATRQTTIHLGDTIALKYGA